MDVHKYIDTNIGWCLTLVGVYIYVLFAYITKKFKCLLYLFVTDEGYSRNVTDEGYSRKVTDESYSRNISDEGYSRNVSDEGYSRNVTDEGYSRNVTDEGYSRNVTDEGYSRNVADEGYSRNVTDEGYSRNVSGEGYSRNVTKKDKTSAKFRFLSKLCKDLVFKHKLILSSILYGIFFYLIRLVRFAISFLTCIVDLSK